MEVSDKNLCFLVEWKYPEFVSTSVRRTALRFSNATESPLGRMTLTGIGVTHSISLAEPRIFGQYALVYVLEGIGTYADAQGWEQAIGPGDLMMVFPELEHLYNPLPGTTWVTSFLCFEGPIFELWRSTGLLDSRRPIHHLEPVDAWSRRIESVSGARGDRRPLVEICRLQELLAAIVSGEGKMEVYQEDLRWAQRACGLIEAHPNGTPDWQKMARQFGLSYEAFRKRFARVTGQTPSRYHMGRRMDRACELMQQGHLTDREISEQLGFCDEFYFSRRFKQITGKSPRHFRRGLAGLSSAQ